jgi:hypothetical protein
VGVRDARTSCESADAATLFIWALVRLLILPDRVPDAIVDTLLDVCRGRR